MVKQFWKLKWKSCSSFSVVFLVNKTMFPVDEDNLLGIFKNANSLMK